MFGFLNFHKPPGCTSRDVVDVAKRLVRPHKTGHAGTLDPLATGVLVVAVGQATRLVEYLQQQPKCYEATFLLGRRSPSEDTETDVELLSDPPIPSYEDIASMLPRFLGVIDQVPPVFSAVKVGGRRSYKLARRGDEPVLTARPITIHELKITRYEYPELHLSIRCGSGTYIRSLGRDLALALGTAAIMSGLIRTQVGPFTLENAVSPDMLSRDNLPQYLHPARTGVSHLPALEFNAEEVAFLLAGRFLDREAPDDSPEFAALDATGDVIAIVGPAGYRLRPLRVFPRD